MSRAIVPGQVSGRALVLTESLSMWGGLDAESGRIIDRRHPQLGEQVTDTVLVLPWGRGSSSAASVSGAIVSGSLAQRNRPVSASAAITRPLCRVGILSHISLSGR